MFVVAQVDLAPTLALLFGLPIPKNSMGTLIPDLFANYTGIIFFLAFALAGKNNYRKTIHSRTLPLHNFSPPPTTYYLSYSFSLAFKEEQ